MHDTMDCCQKVFTIYNPRYDGLITSGIADYWICIPLLINSNHGKAPTRHASMLASVLPVRITCNRVKVEVVLFRILGDVLYPAREGNLFVRGLHENTTHVLHVRYPTFVVRTQARIVSAVVDETRRTIPTKIDDW